MPSGISDFLSARGMHYHTLDLVGETTLFAQKMQSGLEGGASGLMMIPTYLRPETALPSGQSVAVADAGGTHFRTAALSLSGETGLPVIKDFQTFPMPGSGDSVTAQAFFDTLAEVLTPRLGETRKVGFCFSYPAEITPALDGRILALAKEVVIEGAEGHLIGEGINGALMRKGQDPCRVIVLNDSTASLLGGMAQAPSRSYDGYIGFILGTGTNACYIEEADRIKTIPLSERKGRMIVNLESGCYGEIAQGEVDRELDAESQNPADHKLEKMISGGYFGAVLLRTLEKACREGLFSDAFQTRLQGVEALSMKDVDAFCDHPGEDGFFASLLGGEDDRQKLHQVIDILFERAARLSMVQIGGILRHTGKGRSVESPVCVAAEGTFFQKSRTYRQKFDRYTESFLLGELGRHIQVVTAENTILTGAAAAALSVR